MLKFFNNIVITTAVAILFSLTGNYTYAIKFENEHEILKVGGHIEIIEDKEGTLTFEEVVNSENFQRSADEIPNLGVKESIYWIRLEVENNSNSNDLLLELEYPVLDEIQFFFSGDNGKYFYFIEGENHPFKQRMYNHQNFIFDLKIKSGECKRYYLKVSNGEQILLPISIGDRRMIFNAHIIRDILFGIYSGVILVMILYNLFVYFSVRDRSYFYYVIYIFTVGMTQIIWHGYPFKFFWPDSPWFAKQSMVLFASLAGIGINQFMRYFLLMDKYTPKLIYGLYALNLLFIGAIVARLAGYSLIGYNLVDAGAGLISVFVLIVAITISVRGYRPARFFLAAWTIFLIGVFVFVMRNFGILPYNNMTNYTMQLGNAIEVVLLSLALADRINVLKKEKEESQMEAIRVAQEKEKVVLQQNVTLELMVDERTAELAKSNKELKITFEELKQAQSQLVNNEKMASLGQLTAGVAHEINNPINFVSSSIQPLKRNIDDLLTVLRKSEKLDLLHDNKEVIQSIKETWKNLDIDYTVNETYEIIESIGEGASRTAEIVKGLKTFSRLDEGEYKEASIIECIDSTLTIINPELKDSIKVEKRYGSIPLIHCYPGKLSQLFLNIINNAIYAIKAKKIKDGKLTIETFLEANHLVIKISDNGTGMDEATKAKVFEPFFTTKDVGEGTGLGMSISYSIVETHKGDVQIETELGKGTSFIIKLPLDLDAKLHPGKVS